MEAFANFYAYGPLCINQHHNNTGKWKYVRASLCDVMTSTAYLEYIYILLIMHVFGFSPDKKSKLQAVEKLKQAKAKRAEQNKKLVKIQKYIGEYRIRKCMNI